ncbi:MAG: sigma-70 family RNA polymerase sigma factor [Azospirillaceae bacterium]
MALLRACAAGSRAALHALYEADGPLLLGVAWRILRRRELAEEAVHDAFVKIWRRAGSFDPARGAPRAWMVAIARNTALDAARDSARTVATAEPVGAGVVDAAPDPLDVLERLGDRDALRACLETLDEDKRRAILLAYMEGLTHTAIAERTAAPVGTVKSWIRRGLAALRRCLE